MKLKQYFLVFFIFLLVLQWSCRDSTQAEEPAIVECGSALDFYNRGLDTSDFEEKLRLYNEGLKVEANELDTVLPSLLEGKVYALLRLERPQKALFWADSLIKASEYLNDDYYEAKGFYWLYFLHLNANEVKLAYKNLFRSRQLYLEMGDTAGAGWRSLDMAHLKYDMGDLSGTQEAAIEAIKLLDVEEDPHLVSGAYNTIGLTYMDRDFNKEAIKEFKKALELAVNERDSLVFLHNWALALKNQEKYDEALEIFEQLIESNAPNDHSKARYIENYAFTLYSRDSTRNVDSLLFDALKRRKDLGDLYGLSDSYSDLSEYFLQKDKAKAKKYADSFLETSKAINHAQYELLALKKLIKLSPPTEAQNLIDRYISLEDSLDEAELQAKFAFAKVDFDEKQKQDQITQLRQIGEKQSLANERLEWRNAFITLLFIFSAVLGGTLFYYFRQRTRKKNLREVYQTESRIARRIHDELANDLYGVMNKIAPAVPPQTVDQLEEIYRRTRNISRENAEIDTGENFSAFLTGMLSDSSGAAKLVVRGENKVTWEKVSEEKKIVLYRVLQELMVNMKKHSNAKVVAIVFDQQKKRLEVQYSDNGQGMQQDQRISGIGLKNVKNRLSSVGGKLHFTSEENKGFKATIVIPL